jgi:flagellar basal-body rod modification protein FlgD
MTTTSAVNGTAATSATTGAAGIAPSGASETQDRFLKILVSQMKNQDPMNPMDNAQMTSQMAQISTVNGIAQLNETLKGLATQFGASETLQGAGLLGRTVSVTGDQLSLSAAGNAGGTATGAWKLAGAADTVTVSILDANGKAVRTLNAGAQAAGTASFQWDGKDNAGNAVAAGNYQFKVSASKNGAAVGATTYSVGQVMGLAREAGSVSLDLGALGAHSLADLQTIQ